MFLLSPHRAHSLRAFFRLESFTKFRSAETHDSECVQSKTQAKALKSRPVVPTGGSYRFAAQRFAEAQAHFEKILPEYRCNSHFRDRVRQFRNHLSKGIPFFDSREKLGLGDPSRTEEWELLKYVVFSEFLNPDSFFQYLSRSRARYRKARQVMEQAEVAKDRVLMLKALTVMSAQDDQDIEIKKQFGVLSLSIDPNTGGEGYSNDDKDAADEKLRLLRDELRGLAQGAGNAPAPIAAHLLPSTLSGTKENNVGPITVDATSTRGPLSGHPVSEGVANGRVNGNDSVDAVAVQDKPS